MRDVALFACLVVLAAFATGCAPAGGTAARGPVILCSPDASPREVLAAREARRYLYLRTGVLVPVVETAQVLPGAGGVVITRKGEPLAAAVADEGTRKAIEGLASEHYLLKTLERDGKRLLLVAGGDDLGTLYGTYRFAEHLGFRFDLHGDVVPDGRIKLEIPLLNETAGPLFALRGLQIYPDFPEGPDWWNEDDYKTIFAQLAKLRMNFIGIHTYVVGPSSDTAQASPNTGIPGPVNTPNTEPTVWVGLADDIEADGRVRFSYPSSYQNTLRGNWGYMPRPTSQFSFGAGEMFERDDYGAEVMRGECPEPRTPEGCNEVINRTGQMLRGAFEFGRSLGVKTCVGTETPLMVPAEVEARLKAKGLNARDPAVVQSLYEGMFTRIMRAYPLDYFGFWTVEDWTWSGTNREQVQGAITDLKLALAAAKKVGAPFPLAVSGWVLGPQWDRSELDRTLPKDMPLGCINRAVGKDPVEPAFAVVAGREKWAMPWLEDDPGLTSPQLWVGRMQRHALDARRYGCTGLMGVHWRTRAVAPNTIALARAAWDQSGFEAARIQAIGPVGGSVAAYPNNKIEGTDDEPLYQTVRWDVRGYCISVPDGTYKVTLKFCEPFYEKAGMRVFDVSVGGRKVIDQLDIFAKAGRNHALDYTFDPVEARNGRLVIDFGYRVEFPCIAGIVIEGTNLVKKINCGGPAYKDYEADPPRAPEDLPSGDFYKDWAVAEFGVEKGPAIGAVFAKVDGRLPQVADWVDGPGAMRPDSRPWSRVQKEYVFVDELAALRPTGKGNEDRFDYWLNTFEYMRGFGKVRCIFGEYTSVMKKVGATKDPAEQKRLVNEGVLPIRKRLIDAMRPVYAHLLRYVNSVGDMGTVANWDQHVQDIVLTRPGKELERILGSELPEELRRPPVAATEALPHRIFVPTLRSCVTAGEALAIKVVALADQRPHVTLYWRPLGVGDFKAVAATHVARGVYSVGFPMDATRADLEYYVEATSDGGETMRFPVTAPEVCRTVVVMPVGVVR